MSGVRRPDQQVTERLFGNDPEPFPPMTGGTGIIHNRFEGMAQSVNNMASGLGNMMFGNN